MGNPRPMEAYAMLGSRPQKRSVPTQVIVLVVCLCSAVRGADAQDAGCSASSTPTADAIGPKNRFISFDVGDNGLTQAIRVTFGGLPAPFDTWNGVPVGGPAECREQGPRSRRAEQRLWDYWHGNASMCPVLYGVEGFLLPSVQRW